MIINEYLNFIDCELQLLSCVWLNLSDYFNKKCCVESLFIFLFLSDYKIWTCLGYDYVSRLTWYPFFFFFFFWSRAVPSAVFSQPPIGQVGLTEEQVTFLCNIRNF
jgi:hypothetical protein